MLLRAHVGGTAHVKLDSMFCRAPAQNVDGFSANVVAKFFGFLPGPPQFYTYAAAVTQVAGSGLLAVGVLSRPVAASMLATMAVAVVFHLLNTGPEGFPFAVVKQHSYNYELAAMYVAVLGYFTAAGAGRLSVDELVRIRTFPSAYFVRHRTFRAYMRRPPRPSYTAGAWRRARVLRQEVERGDREGGH